MDQNNPYNPNTAPSGAAPRRRPPRETPYTRRALFFTGNVLGLGFLGYLLMSLLYSMALRSFEPLRELYLNVPLYTYLMEIVYSYMCVGLPFLIVFMVLRRTRLYHELRLPYGAPYQTGEAALLVPAALALCFVGSIAANYVAALADANGFGFLSYYEALEPEPVPSGLLGVTVLTLRSALVPALLEEFAFRGVILQTLRKYGDWFAIVSSAVLFGLMHGNLTQMPFAIIAGIAMGYVAVVTGSLRTSIAVHFINNFVSVAIALISDRMGESASIVASNTVVYAGIGIGLVCIAVYFFRKPNALRLRPGMCGRVGGKGRALFLAPVLLIAILWLLWYTVNDISGFAEWVKGL